MDLPELRLINFRRFISADCENNAAEAARRIRRSASQVNDLLAGRKSFGEKFARSIEPLMGKPAGWLDKENEAAPDDPVLMALNRRYQDADATKKAAMSDLASLPDAAAADLAPILAALKHKYQSGEHDKTAPSASPGGYPGLDQLKPE